MLWISNIESGSFEENKGTNMGRYKKKWMGEIDPNHMWVKM